MSTIPATTKKAAPTPSRGVGRSHQDDTKLALGHRGHGDQRLLDDLDVQHPDRRRRQQAGHQHRADTDRAVRQAGLDVQRPGRLDHHPVPAAGERGEPRFDAVYIGTEPVTSFTDLNEQLNKLLEVAQ